MNFSFLLILLASPLTGIEPVPLVEKPRVIILTDIGGDPDDTQSLIRLLLYTNELEIEGLIASAAGTPGELKKDLVRPDLIRQVIEAYAQVQVNLRRHNPEFPEAKALLNKVKSGNPRRGKGNLGPGKDTEGSDWIITVVDRPDPRPVNICVWGGPTELAQALDRVKRERSPAQLREFIKKIRVFSIGHQDDSGPGILRDFPDLFYILSMAPDGKDKRQGMYRGMYLGGDESLTSRKWVDENVRVGHGPLGALYPTQTWTAPNPNSCLKEGDTPSLFYFLPNQPGHPNHPEWGNWGGRYVQLIETNNFRDAREPADSNDPRWQVWRWRPHYQAEFQARMDWCLQPFEKANHRPLARLKGMKDSGPILLSFKSGETAALDASPSIDPDNNKLSFNWQALFESPTNLHRFLNNQDSAILKITVPKETKGWQLHLLLTVTDDGSPALRSYRRVHLTCAPGN
ncbi:MAG: DUF1593 domain-containing protein [Gemmataceae bacterium]|nr:DUF1593 domain-containing protein [Gemmataceae bacterium]